MKTLKPFKKKAVFVLLLAGCLLPVLSIFAESLRKLPFDPVHIERIREISRLTSRLGDTLWPGFDFNKVPFVMNVDNRWEVFIHHPTPPANCRLSGNYDVNGARLAIQDECHKFLGKNSGTVCKIGGITSTYVSTLNDSKTGDTTEEYLAIVLHESFHVYQREIRQREAGPYEEFPIYDGEQAGMLALENNILHEALKQKDTKNLEKLARMFVAVRTRRRGKLSDAVRRHEDFENFSEGTAMYVQVRLFDLLAKKGTGKSPLTGKDSHYNGFRESGTFFRKHVDKLLPADDRPVTLGNHIYENGMGQAFLLDLVRPSWKKEMGEKGISQFTILRQHFPLDEPEIPALAADAEQRFNYDKLLTQQENLIADYLSTVREFIEAKGRRYRIYHGNIKARFRWLTREPYYFLIPGLLNEKDSETGMVLIYARGIERFEKGDLVFKSKEVPVIFRHDYLEWIDSQPAADFSDLAVKADMREKDICHNLVLTSDGFTLRVKCARIKKSPNLVAIHPISGSNREINEKGTKAGQRSGQNVN